MTQPEPRSRLNIIQTAESSLIVRKEKLKQGYHVRARRVTRGGGQAPQGVRRTVFCQTGMGNSPSSLKEYSLKCIKKQYVVVHSTFLITRCLPWEREDLPASPALFVVQVPTRVLYRPDLVF
ncbi:hypothetical protein E2C01_052483 [Portunus trituberculatus]|uniref:Uncharacterized protein n=1 Tax=Portunus trituberculatus TaxID=210409 RepID=A0A5B7GN55_PORTR|nr:hypothetical protein [Portunus trituberculatus]